jgi:hypothetical protein
MAEITLFRTGISSDIRPTTPILGVQGDRFNKLRKIKIGGSLAAMAWLAALPTVLDLFGVGGFSLGSMPYTVPGTCGYPE